VLELAEEPNFYFFDMVQSSPLTWLGIIAGHAWFCLGCSPHIIALTIRTNYLILD
jgi:hypothetical protein